LSKELSKKVKLESDIFNILAEGFASKLVDETVDILLTPGNLLRLINGEEPSSILRNEKVSFNENNSYEILERINYKFESHKKFSVFVRGKNKKVIQLMLRRSGFQWQLSNITIPDIN
jgi:glycogen debranching enzyme